MKILVIHLGRPCDCLLSTGVLRALKKKYVHVDIFCIAKSKESVEIFSYCKSVRKTYRLNRVPKEFLTNVFDIIINLDPLYNYFKGENCLELNSKQLKGFYIDENTDRYLLALKDVKKINKNIFQIYFNLSGLTWKGEGFSCRYRPKARTKKSRTGLSITNSNLRRYIIKKLHLDDSKIYSLPYRSNIFSKMDEVNKCGRLITDDYVIMNIGLSLKKEVHFLQTVDCSVKLELFGNHLYKIPTNVYK